MGIARIASRGDFTSNSLTPTNEASQVNHSSYQRGMQVSSLLALLPTFAIIPKGRKIAFHRSDLISIINCSCLSLELQE